MLAQVSTLKSRLAIADTDVQYDDLLTNALVALSTRFEKEYNRIFTRIVDATYEFNADDLDISVPIFPIESVSKFELKENETDGWVEQTDVKFLIRKACVISIVPQTLNYRPSTLNDSSIARVTYTGGFLLPGSADVRSTTRLPSDIEQAAVEQAVAWFMNRGSLGIEIKRLTPADFYQKFSQLDFLPRVRTVLKRYERWVI
jgi:hypothetical protein